MSQSPLDNWRTEIVEWSNYGWGPKKIAKHLQTVYSVETSETAVRRAKRRFGIGAAEAPVKGVETAGARIEGDKATLISAANPQGTSKLTPEDLFRQHGLNPDEWTYSHTMNCWDALVKGGRVTTLHQLKVSARRKPEWLLENLAVQNTWKPPKVKPNKAKTGDVRHILFIPDPHAPHHEQEMMECVWMLMADLKPEEVVWLGDATDNSPWSRHKPNPRFSVTTEEALWSTYDLLATGVQAAPKARHRLVGGNHEWWLYDRLKETYPELVTLRRPGEDEPYLQISKLLRLDDLGIEMQESLGEYHDVVLEIEDDLVAMHGTKTGKHGGAVIEIEGWEGVSVIQGHDHKTAIIAVNKRLGNGGHTQRYAISAGTCAARDLGYDPKQNVSQSLVVVTSHPDGRWHPELVLFDPIRRDLTWRDKRYHA